MKKIRIAILYGGKSAEHEVSLQSARNVIRALDKDKYRITALKISKSGAWSSGILRDIFHNRYDVVFPVMHGTFGEDGTVQGLLKLAGVPFVGVSVLGSAVCMDKDAAKRLLRDAGIPVAKFITLRDGEEIPAFSKVRSALGLPLFVKPANLGSSVGISKVKREKDYKPALEGAFAYDSKILIEEAIDGREIEVSVLGNEEPVASVPGEIIPHDEFYTYTAKYIARDGAALLIPAKLPKTEAGKLRAMAVKAFTVLECEGMARVDFFLRKNGDILVNELNTIPGFTNISMYPKLWEASGLPYAKLVDRLVRLALNRHTREKRLKTTR